MPAKPDSRLLSPLLAAALFCASAAAATSLTSTFSPSHPARLALLALPLPFLLLFILSELHWFRRAPPPQRQLLLDSLVFAATIAGSVLLLGELFAYLGARLWDPTQVWPYVLLLAGLLGYRRARARNTT